MSLFFKNREGQTPLQEEMRFDLKQKHVQDMTELYELESENIAVGIAWSHSTNLNHLEYPTWLELHKKMLGDVWKFAGTIRQVELNNPDFHMPYNIRPALLELEKDLKYWIEHKTHTPKLMMAHFHERLLTIHPFKDGNGRWSRVLTEFICMKENFDIPNWGANIKEDDLRRKAYIDAIKSARHEHNHQALADVMFSETSLFK